MKKTALSVMCALLYSAAITSAQIGDNEATDRGEILGRELGADNGSALKGVSVLVRGRFGGTSSNDNGDFCLGNLPSGLYTVTYRGGIRGGPEALPWLERKNVRDRQPHSARHRRMRQ